MLVLKYCIMFFRIVLAFLPGGDFVSEVIFGRFFSAANFSIRQHTMIEEMQRLTALHPKKFILTFVKYKAEDFFSGAQLNCAEFLHQRCKIRG